MILFTPVPNPITAAFPKVSSKVAERLNERIGSLLVDVEYSLEGDNMEIITEKDPFFMEHYINRTVEATIYQSYEELLDQAVRSTPVMERM